MATRARRGGARTPSRETSSTTPQTSSSAANIPERERKAFAEYVSKAGEPFAPSVSTAFRIIVLIRVMGAMNSSNFNDCDEVYNYWEPLHFLVNRVGFQTWEYAPQYALRAWSYLVLHFIPSKLVATLFIFDKRPSFFIVRILLGMFSSYAEAKFYRSLVDHVNVRIGRYALCILIFSAGMWSASTALLPNTLSMHLITLGFSYAMQPPSPSNQRTRGAVLCFAASALLGWPFATVLAVPYVLEEFSTFLKVQVSNADDDPSTISQALVIKKYMAIFKYGLFGLLFFGLPTVLLDRMFYGRWTWSTLNLFLYNFKGGDDLYGTESPTFYLKNLFLNFNLASILAIVSGPLLFLCQICPFKINNMPQSKDAYRLLYVRLLPLYLWFVLLSSRSHKEERFGFPAYPLIAYAAAVTIYCLRSLMETVIIHATGMGGYRASRLNILSTQTLSILITTSILSIARILALRFYYNAPMDITASFQYNELSKRAMFAQPDLYQSLSPQTFEFVNQGDTWPVLDQEKIDQLEEEILDYDGQIDLLPIHSLNLSLCYQDEWYRFPSHFLFPHGVNIEFVEPTTFEGLLPKKFYAQPSSSSSSSLVSRFLLNPLLERIQTTQSSSVGFNDQNQKVIDDRFVPISSCDYFVHLNFPHRPQHVANRNDETSALNNNNKNVFNPDEWKSVTCKSFLDAENSEQFSRWFWLPGKNWQKGNKFGDFCIYRKI